MPSGVSQGALSADAGPEVSAKATLVKSGIRLICSVNVSAILLLKNIVSRVQCRQGVATFVNERLHARGVQNVVPRGGPPDEINLSCAASFERRNSRCQFRLRDLAGYAQARNRCPRGLIIGYRSAECLDAAGREKIGGKVRARGELRRRTERGEENFRPRAGCGEDPIGFVAQGFEWLGEPQSRQCWCGYARGFVAWRGARRHIEYGWRRFGDIGIGIGAGQNLLSSHQCLLARRPHRADVALDKSAFQRRPCAAGLFDLLKLRPGGEAKLLGQSFEGAGS